MCRFRLPALFGGVWFGGDRIMHPFVYSVVSLTANVAERSPPDIKLPLVCVPTVYCAIIRPFVQINVVTQSAAYPLDNIMCEDEKLLLTTFVSCQRPLEHQTSWSYVTNILPRRRC